MSTDLLLPGPIEGLDLCQYRVAMCGTLILLDAQTKKSDVRADGGSITWPLSGRSTSSTTMRG